MVIRSAFHALTIRSRHNRNCLVVCLDGWVSSSRGAIQALVTWVGGLSRLLSLSLISIPLIQGIISLFVLHLCLHHFCSRRAVSFHSPLDGCLFSDALLLPFYHLSHLSISHFLSRSAVNHDPYPQFSLLCMCMWDDAHLPFRNDIILLLCSQSDASTWSPAFRGVLCTQERQGGREILK